MWNDELLDAVLDIAMAAGQEILEVYNDIGQPEVTMKDDQSPLTDADRRAHRVIVSRLAELEPRYQILSEESETVTPRERLGWQSYWLVDPLDGTKEFVSRNGEFTVNIALIKDGEPVLGVVHVPVTGDSYLGRHDPGSSNNGAWYRDGAGHTSVIHSRAVVTSGQVNVVASRRHRGALLEALLADLENKFASLEVVSMGSSLKICLLAAGKADLYPRLAPTSEWDTAAAHAVLRAAGGEIYDTALKPLRYNQKADILNPHFIAIADTSFAWEPILKAHLS